MANPDVEFRFGEIVHLRHFQHRTVGGLYTLRAVRHDAAGLLLWGAEGSRYWHLTMPDGRHMNETPLAEWVTASKIVVGRIVRHAMLSWHPTGASYSVRFFYRQGTFTNWYANLEQPAVARRGTRLACVDTVDWDLDVWIDANREWRWKDEDEFVDRLRWPRHYWVSDEASVRKAGQDVIALVEAGVFPFDGTWCDFQPDDSWKAIVAEHPPDGWDQPPD